MTCYFHPSGFFVFFHEPLSCDVFLTSCPSSFLLDHSGLRRPHLVLISIQLLKKGAVKRTCFSLTVPDLASETSAGLKKSLTLHARSDIAIEKAIIGKLREHGASNWARVPDISLVRSPDTD